MDAFAPNIDNSRGFSPVVSAAEMLEDPGMELVTPIFRDRYESGPVGDPIRPPVSRHAVEYLIVSSPRCPIERGSSMSWAR